METCEGHVLRHVYKKTRVEMRVHMCRDVQRHAYRHVHRDGCRHCLHDDAAWQATVDENPNGVKYVGPLVPSSHNYRMQMSIQISMYTHIHTCTGVCVRTHTPIDCSNS